MPYKQGDEIAMPVADPKVDAFLAKAKKWREEMQALRAILNDSPLSEDFKWYQPCYTYQNSNIVILSGLKDHCWLAFFKGALLSDPQNILTKPGENSRHSRVIKFTNLEQIAAVRQTIHSYIEEAIALEKAGIKVDLKASAALDYPPELEAIFDKNIAFKTAFEALTPGRQRGYILHFTQPKQSATRTARIEKASQRIFEGLGMHDR